LFCSLNTICYDRAGAVDVGPHFELNTSKGHAEIRKSTDILEYQTGNLKLSVNTSPNNFDIKFTNDRGKKLTSHSSRSVGYITDETNSPFTDGLYREFAKYAFAALDVGVQETFYGLGERFGPFVKNGQSVEMSNEDGGTSSQLTYKNIPFYISSKGYGVFVNNPGKVSFEVQSERTTRVNMSVPGESIEYFVIYGPTPKEVISKYTALTGRAAIPPSWTYNLWLTTSFTTNYNEQTVTGFLDGFKERDIPLGTFHFDAFWMKGYQVRVSGDNRRKLTV
jgi:alpha-D-xyloside xylohydrolase